MNLHKVIKKLFSQRVIEHEGSSLYNYSLLLLVCEIEAHLKKISDGINIKTSNNHYLVCADWKDSYTASNIVNYATTGNYFSYLEICCPIKK